MKKYTYEKSEYSSPKPKGKRSVFRGFLIILIVVFCLTISSVGIVGMIVKDKSFSESENRVLASRPKLSLSGVIDGSFMKKYETYLTDQFVLRDKLISMKALIDEAAGKREENGVYIGSDGYLFDEQNEIDKAQQKNIIQAIGDFTSKNKTVKSAMILAPNATSVLSQKLPYSIELTSQTAQLKAIKKALSNTKITWVDAVTPITALNEKGTQVYYKTDHHWTTRAAYGVFKTLAKTWSLDTTDVKYKFYTVTDSFEGTLASTSGIHSTVDKIEICTPVSESSYVVNYESQKTKTTSVFDESKLETKNKYEVFFGGNFDKIVISTSNKSMDNLLVIKDSYANCLIPMLTPYFSRIVVVDPRYLTESLSTIMGDYDFTHVLFCYNLNTYLEDVSLADSLAS